MPSPLAGLSLAQLLARRVRLPVAGALFVGVSLCEALKPLHAAAHVHAAIAPSTTFLGADGEVALAPPSALPDDAAAAPEQLGGGPIDARVDQFLVAATVWHAITGRRLAPARPAPAPSTARRGLPVEVDAIFARALDVDAGARFRDIGALGGALDEYAARDTWRAFLAGVLGPINDRRRR